MATDEILPIGLEAAALVQGMFPFWLSDFNQIST
jgi:hypothetical protein